MDTPNIQFLSFAGCPLAAPARDNLMAALKQCGLVDFVDVDLLSETTPTKLKSWGSPTILVEGKDVMGMQPGQEVCCRIYATAERVPSVQHIASVIAQACASER